MSIQLILNALRSEIQKNAQEESSLGSQTYRARTAENAPGMPPDLSETLTRPIDGDAHLIGRKQR